MTAREIRRITAKNWPKRVNYRIGLSVVRRLSSLYAETPSKKLYVRPNSKATRVRTVVPSPRPAYYRRVIVPSQEQTKRGATKSTHHPIH